MSNEANIVSVVGEKVPVKHADETQEEEANVVAKFGDGAQDKPADKTLKEEAPVKHIDETQEEEANFVSKFGVEAQDKPADKTLHTDEIQKEEASVVAKFGDEAQDKPADQTLKAEAPEKHTDETQKVAANVVAKFGDEVEDKPADKTQKEVAPEQHTDETQEAATSEKPEEGLTKVILRSGDGEEFEVELALLKASVTINNMIDEGFADGCVPLPNVMANELGKLITYLKHHIGANEEEMSELKGWNAEFVDVGKDFLFDIMIAAHYLDVKPLQDLTCQAIANTIKDMEVQEVRDYFGIVSDFTQEEEAKHREDHVWAFD